MSVTTKTAIINASQSTVTRLRAGDRVLRATAEEVRPAVMRADQPRSPHGRVTLERMITGPGPLSGDPRLGGYLPSRDSRYVRFVDAVQALRLDREFTTLTPVQIARIMEAAEGIFMLDDGIPREVRPAPPDPETTAPPEIQTESAPPDPPLHGPAEAGGETGHGDDSGRDGDSDSRELAGLPDPVIAEPAERPATTEGRDTDTATDAARRPDDGPALPAAAPEADAAAAAVPPAPERPPPVDPGTFAQA